MVIAAGSLSGTRIGGLYKEDFKVGLYVFRYGGKDRISVSLLFIFMIIIYTYSTYMWADRHSYKSGKISANKYR